MCRFLAYKGSPIVLYELLYKPKNSLIHQSYHALERRDPVNADGFGVGWYMPDISPEPALFTGIQPAWNNRNLRNLTAKTRSGCVLAHVRAAGTGDVAISNCHPFQYQKLLMMHNGDLGGFGFIKRKLRERLSDEAYNWIKGETDSEHFFALFLTHLLKEPKDDYTHEEIVSALQNAVAELKDVLAEQNIPNPFYLNVVVSDGGDLIALRYDTDPNLEPPTLYYSRGSRYECHDNGICRIVEADPSEHAVLIVSEKLTDVLEDWHQVPPAHFVVVTEKLETYLMAIDV